LSHNPVQGAILGAATGFEAAGLPGAAIAILTSTIAAFRKEKRPPPFPPVRMAIWRRWQGAFRPHVRTIGKAWVNEFNLTAERQFRSDITTWNRKGLWIIDDSFFQLSNHDAEAILAAMGAGLVTVEGQDLVLVSSNENVPVITTPAEVLPQSITPGGKTMVIEKINRGNFNEGLGNELETPQKNFELGALVNPTIDIGRYLPVDPVEGAADQFFSDISVLLSTSVTGLRISADTKPGRVIFIRRAHLSVSPSSASTPTYRFFAGAARKGEDTVETKMHFEVLRRSATPGIAATIVDLEIGNFAVPLGKDYLMRMDNLVGGGIRMSGSVEGYFLDKGVNGSKC